MPAEYPPKVRAKRWPKVHRNSLILAQIHAIRKDTADKLQHINFPTINPNNYNN